MALRSCSSPRTAGPARLLASGCTALVVLALFAAPSRAESPTLTAVDGPYEANDENQWSVPLTLWNPTGAGLYLDSLAVDSAVLDEGETRGPRRTTLPLPQLARLLGSVGTQQGDRLVYQGPAVAEHARLTFRAWVHGAEVPATVLSATAEVMPSAFSREHPSEFVTTAAGRKVEVVFLPAVTTRSAGAPGVLMVHGHGSHARLMLAAARALADSGFAVMAVSQPGYGRSEGPADYIGPATIAAVGAALDDLAKRPGVDPTRHGAWGASRGGGAVATVATRRADLDAVITEGGVYDLWALARGTQIPGIADNIVAEAGPDSAAWRERSPLLAASKVKAAVLVLQGERDRNVPAGQAHAWADALKAAGVPVEARFFPAAEHRLPRSETRRLAHAFLRRTLQP